MLFNLAIFFMVVCLVAGFTFANISDSYGASRSIWPHRIFFALAVLFGTIAIILGSK